MDGVRRLNKRKPKKAKPATLDVIEEAVAGIPADLRGLRDRAIILLGFWAARRRSELSGLDVSSTLTAGATGHIEFVPEGLVIRLADQQDEPDRRHRGLCRAARLRSLRRDGGPCMARCCRHH